MIATELQLTNLAKGWHRPPKKLSEEHKHKISLALRGVNVGPKSPFWRGGVTAKNLLIRQSAEYRAWRKAVYERDNYTCVFCDVRGVKLAADHIKRFSDFPELRFELSNGRTLCVPCHKTTDNFGRKGTANKVKGTKP